jgi:hypothetical protein
MVEKHKARIKAQLTSAGMIRGQPRSTLAHRTPHPTRAMRPYPIPPARRASTPSQNELQHNEFNFHVSENSLNDDHLTMKTPMPSKSGIVRLSIRSFDMNSCVQVQVHTRFNYLCAPTANPLSGSLTYPNFLLFPIPRIHHPYQTPPATFNLIPSLRLLTMNHYRKRTLRSLVKIQSKENMFCTILQMLRSFNTDSQAAR